MCKEIASECVAVSARRYGVVWRWCCERGKTETLRSLRSSMLSWGKCASAGSSKPPAQGAGGAHRAAAAGVASSDDTSDTEAVESALLAGSTALARRRHAIKLKRKSKIFYRIIRSVYFCLAFDSNPS